MKSLASIVPEFVGEITLALSALGRTEISEKLGVALVKRWIYDRQDDLGYVYFDVPPPSMQFAQLAAPIAKTLSLYDEHGANIDVTHDGDLFGVELLGRKDVIAKIEAGHEP